MIHLIVVSHLMLHLLHSRLRHLLHLLHSRLRHLLHASYHLCWIHHLLWMHLLLSHLMRLLHHDLLFQYVYISWILNVVDECVELGFTDTLLLQEVLD